MAAILEPTVGAERAKVYFISADRNALMSRSEAVVENRDATQMRDMSARVAELAAAWPALGDAQRVL